MIHSRTRIKYKINISFHFYFQTEQFQVFLLFSHLIWILIYLSNSCYERSHYCGWGLLLNLKQLFKVFFPRHRCLCKIKIYFPFFLFIFVDMYAHYLQHKNKHTRKEIKEYWKENCLCSLRMYFLLLARLSIIIWNSVVWQRQEFVSCSYAED